MSGRVRSFSSQPLEGETRAWRRHQLIRISCANLNRIQHEDGRYLTILSRSRLRGGKRVLTPVGGAFRYHDASVFQSLRARFSVSESGDLRFSFDESLVPLCESWFRSRQGRETLPYRELHEELGVEECLVPDLNEQDVDMEYVGLAIEQRVNTRPEAMGALTRYYFEIFNVSSPKQYGTRS